MTNWIHSSIFLCTMALITLTTPVHGQSDTDERAELIRTQNALRILREFEHDSRHLYFLQANAIIAVHGGWNEGDLAYATHSSLLGEAAESLLLPKFKRLSARLASNKNFSDEEKSRLQSAVDQILQLVEHSKSITEALNAGDPKLAIAIYHDQSVPKFVAIWAANYTLISEAEKRFPRK